MEDLTLGGMASWIGLICLWIAVIWQLLDIRKRKKERTYEIVPKDPWWKQTYIWIIFFRRTRYRPIASTFPWLIFLAPAMFMVFAYCIFFISIAINGKAKTLEEMHQVSGVVTKVKRGQGKGSYDYIRLKDDNSNEETYRLCCFYYDEEAEEFKRKIQDTQTRVDVWYQDEWFLESYKEIQELKVNGEFVKLQSGNIIREYDYEWFVQRDENAFPNLLWWLNYSLFGWMWLWFLNRKELPIHRLNKQKMYEKYNLKDE